MDSQKVLLLFVILFWQRVLSENPCKLEENNPPTNSALIVWEAGHCWLAVSGSVNRKTSSSQLYSLRFFETSVEPQSGHQVYGASRLGWSAPKLCARISGYELLLVLIFPDLPRNSSLPCSFVHPHFFFIPFLFISVFCPALGLQTAMKQTFRNGQLWGPCLGSPLYPGSELGVAKISPRR